jgi:hypothetical protein
MFNLRRIAPAFLVALVGVCIWVGVNSWGNRELSAWPGAPPTAECEDCQSLKMSVPEDPQEREIAFQRFSQDEATREAKRVETVRARAYEWQGCKFRPAAPPANVEDYARQKVAADLLSANETMPQGRVDFFEPIFAHEDYCVVGWVGTVTKVVDAPDGTRIELLVQPALTTAAGGLAYTLQTYRETWRIDANGRLSLEKAESGGGLCGIAGN